MLFRQLVKSNRRHTSHFNGAEILIIFKPTYSQNIARFKMAFGFVPNRDGFAPGENIGFKALVESDVVRLHFISESAVRFLGIFATKPHLSR